ncbi:HAD family hydrolase [Nocardia niigatensis]
MTGAADILQQAHTLLLDFDGPICAVFSGITNREAAQRLLINLDHSIPDDVLATHDPFDVLQFAATLGPDQANATDLQFRQIEVEAVQSARPTTGSEELIRSSAQSGRRIAIVSNNSSAAVRRYLTQHELIDCVQGVFGRESGDMSRLKPQPHLLLDALSALQSKPKDSVFVGDSASDVIAARAANVPCIAFANRPAKAAVLAAQAPAAIITQLSELLSAA